MLLALPSLTVRWQAELGRAVELGIGINSGLAWVGNTGSAQKFKYGLLVDTVNIASRVQGATKYLGADCLFSGGTRTAFQDSQCSRRLARVRLVNIDRPIELYELTANPSADWEYRCRSYEQALIALEKDQLQAALEQVAVLRTSYPKDGALIALEKRITEALLQENGNPTAIWHLPGK